MKLIPLAILTLTLAVDVKPQKYRQDHFPFSPQFQTPSSGIFGSDSSLYLPPESHTPLPYFPIKNHNLPFPYLPPTGTKAPSIYPTPFPIMVSSSLSPNFDDDDDEEDSGRIRMSTSQPLQQRFNNSERGPDPAKERREMRNFPNMVFHQPIDRVDTKFPVKVPNNPGQSQGQGLTTPATTNQPPSRRMIISADTHRNDLGLDQIKAASYQGNHQFINPIYVSSTTEPAIPILRLSNEMDLDGSFSYEALGADQTHYVQHSRMENMGTEKEEQVVEGSYSYVGDNGQTYTVHYVADSNGFRASGDHLPVPPPVPEIIQRAVQYNLQEEAKRPPHLKSWQDDKDNEISESQHYIPPPRNLFTGRTPEAFSYSYSQGSNTGNNLVASASNQVPVKSNDAPTDQSKGKSNNGPIAPQITFLASQGAHLPSMNTVQNTISRMFNTEKPALPQLMNYEAAIKDMDQQESNKALWRWQYGINANNLNQNANKDSISRSFGEPSPDDVMINFSEMNPDQYTQMIKSQLESNAENIGVNQYKQPLSQPQFSQIKNHQFGNYYQNQDTNALREQQDSNMNSNINNNEYLQRKENKQSENQTTPQSTQTTISSEDWYKLYNNNHNHQSQSTAAPVESREHKFEHNAKLITQHNFVFPSQTQSYDVTQSYDFDESYYEPRRIKALNTDVNVKTNTNNINDVAVNNKVKNIATSNPWENQPESEMKILTTPKPSISTVKEIKFVDFIVPEDKNTVRPITKTTTEVQHEKEVTTTEASVEEIIENNIFLKNLFKVEKAKPQNVNKVIIDEPKSKISIEPKKEITTASVEADPKTDKVPKYIQYVSNSKPMNEIKTIKKKPMDINDILNYVTLKNHFESNKMLPKAKTVNTDINDHRNDVRFIPIQHEVSKPTENLSVDSPSNNFRSLNHEHEELPLNSDFRPMNQEQIEKPLNNNFRTFSHEQLDNSRYNDNASSHNFRTLSNEQQELRGIIKNYKVLQRNNNPKNYDNHQLKRELSPPPLKLSSPNLPPLGRAGPSMKSYLPPIYV